MPEYHNNHITVYELLSLFNGELAEYEEYIGQHIVASPLGKLKEVADATTKFLLSSKDGVPLSVFISSRPCSPGLIMRGVENAKAIRAVIGDRLGSVVIRSIKSGYAAGRSYVILPWYREFSSFKLIKKAQYVSLTRSLFQWLHDVNEAAAGVYGSSSETSDSFRNGLDHLLKQDFLNDEITLATAKSIERIESGKWKPRYTVDHNDLWMGNVMLQPGSKHSKESPYPYVIIDWAGANHKGFGVYDLFRLARSLNIPDIMLRNEMIKHSKALRCDIEDTQGHLLACLGRLHQQIEYFPKDKYLKVLYNCWTTFTRIFPDIT